MDQKDFENAFKNKVVIYCRLSREINKEPETDADKFKKRLNEKFKDISNYKPYHGFYDLRNFRLNDNEFKNFWITQDLLNYSESYKETLKNKIPDLYTKIKELSANYQQDLLSHEELEEEIEK